MRDHCHGTTQTLRTRQTCLIRNHTISLYVTLVVILVRIVQREIGKEATMRTYEIGTTNGQYLRESMTTATEETVYDVLRRAAEYTGMPYYVPETWDDGRIVSGHLVATPRARYAVRCIADAECTRLGHTLAEYDSAELAITAGSLVAAELAGVYGSAIEDRETGLIDWGHGFGVAIQGAAEGEVR